VRGDEIDGGRAYCIGILKPTIDESAWGRARAGVVKNSAGGTLGVVIGIDGSIIF